jgi:hypothetical protein
VGQPYCLNHVEGSNLDSPVVRDDGVQEEYLPWLRRDYDFGGLKKFNEHSP